jgi:anti-sigma B factor antagonist
VEHSVREVGGVTVVTVRGKILGGPESEGLRVELDRILGGPSRRLLVDLAGVPWMNSAGLGILLSAYARMREQGGELRLAGAGTRVLDILRTTKLLTVLVVLDDERSGIRSFEEGPSADRAAGARTGGVRPGSA